MVAEARITPIWKKQKLLVALFIIAFGLYFFLDGLYRWPKSNERFLAHKKFEKEDNLKDWPAYAKSRGWVLEPPDKFYEKYDLYGQYFFGTLALVGGGIMLIYWFTQIGRVVRMDEEAVYAANGKRVPFEAITGVGKKRWDSKGIAKVRYKLDGRKGGFVVDDYKFDTEPSRKILATIEEKLKARSGDLIGEK